MDSTAAKQFLVSRVIAEAESEHLFLSEVETKMLQFTEVHPTLPDILEVNAEFERSYDPDEYEKKVAGLLKRARDNDQQDISNRERWIDALAAVKGEDHYILVMVDKAFRGSAANQGHRLRDFLIYIAIGIGVVLILFVASLWRAAY